MNTTAAASPMPKRRPALPTQAIAMHPQRGPSAPEQLAIREHTALAARLKQILIGVPIDTARAALDLVAAGLETEQAVALAPLPNYMIKKREHWGDQEKRLGTGQVINVGGSRAIYTQAIGTGKYQPADELPVAHVRACMDQAVIDRATQRAMEQEAESGKKQEAEKLKQAGADAEAELQKQRETLAQAPFDLATADAKALLGHLTAIWPEQLMRGKITDFELPTDAEGLRVTVREVSDVIKNGEPVPE